MLANILTDFTDWLDEISAHWWFLLVILAVALLDSVIPIVPSETTVILGGVAAGQGNQNLLLVIAAGAVGHIFNLGHGVLPTTDADAITEAVRIIHEEN